MENKTGNYKGKRLAPEEREVPKSRGRRFWSEYGYLIVTVIVVVLVFRVFLQLAWVPSGSMETTIPQKSLIISWQLPYLVGDPEPQRGDIVTFWDEELGRLLVKRVIGLPGETVRFKGGYVYVNDERLTESYLDQQGVTNSPNQSTFQVPEGSLLMLGDNRTDSLDSRYWENPYIPFGSVRAKALVNIPVTSWRKIPLPDFKGIHSVA